MHVLLLSRLFCSVLLLLSLLIHVVKPAFKIKLNLFAQLFYCAMRQESLMLFYGNYDFQRNKQISKEPERKYWTHATHSVWAQETLFDDGKFPSQKHPKQSLNSRNVFWTRLVVNFLWRANARWRTNGIKMDLIPKEENKRVQTNGSNFGFQNSNK